jgi:O-succinylbenzoate-CoA ligase
MNHLMPCPIAAHARLSPANVALRDGNTSLTYAQLDQAIDVAVAALAHEGVSPGATVAVISPNSTAHAVLFFAAFRLGYVLMPLNGRWSAADWRAQLDDARCQVLVFSSEYLDRVADLPIIKIPMERIIAAGASLSAGNVEKGYALDREALIIHTSGTSGSPRGVVLTWANLTCSAWGTVSALSCGRDDWWLAALPFYHVGGILIPWRAALTGAGVEIVGQYSPERILDVIGQKQGGYWSLVPTMLADLIRIDSAERLHHAKAIILGGAPCDETLQTQIIRRKLPVLTTYGMTEASSMVTLLPYGRSSRRLNSSGTVLPYRQMRVVDGQGQPLRPGELGRITVRGEILFARYVGEQTPPVDADGWFDTGDMGSLDEDGFLTVRGRADQMIVSGGENIDVRRIEQELTAVDGITDAVVLSRPDRRWGARPVAFVVVADAALTESAIKSTLARRLGKIMIPDRIVIVPSLPRTGIGKYDCIAIRDQYRHVWDDAG